VKEALATLVFFVLLTWALSILTALAFIKIGLFDWNRDYVGNRTGKNWEGRCIAVCCLLYAIGALAIAHFASPYIRFFLTK
jgi:hypothetical protein